MLRGPAKQYRIIRMEATTIKTQEILLPSNVTDSKRKPKANMENVGYAIPNLAR
jgi:hypothetical protein